MTYAFPPSLHPLRDYLKGQGADTRAFVSARQAAFMAQQLLGTRVKFPDKGADMTSTLFLIQKAVTEGSATIKPDPFNNPVKAKKGKDEKIPPFRKSKKDHSNFSPAMFAEGIHIFCDGASVPNPGVGGWGVVVYDNGQELRTAFGGDPETTNNQMELTGLLNAIEQAKALSDNPTVTIWCDSQYSVNGANDWRHKWKRNGWKKSPAATEHVKNADLWKAIDEALSNTASRGISIKWVKGHADIAGNERADQLAEQGRQQVLERGAVEVGLVDEVNELDARFRQIMGAE
ncbi:ribonuclease H [Agrobacterium cavarae]|uniref:ribonuclease H family protein n=1 Tax=Agrobacterium cavarae TaxID=2528239 RepID=UPI002FFA8126